MVDTTHEADDMNTEGQYIPKSYQFERDMDIEELDRRHDTLKFDEQSNEHFVYDDVDDLINTSDGLKDLANMLSVFFTSQQPRIKTLKSYSKGQNTTILSGRRRIEKEKADYRISHNYGGYISDFITGFILGNPLTVGSDLEDTDDIEDIEDIHFGNDIDALNYDLAYDASRYGRAFELHYRDEEKEDRIVLINPDEMFVVRTADVTKQVIAGVHCPVYNGQVHLTVYTDSFIIEYELFKKEAIKLTEKKRKKHLYGMVPIVEWWNNRYRSGDFESVIPIIDAYDSAQSDTANYMSDLNDAMLVISGDVESSGLNVNDLVTMAQANILVLESGMTADGKESKLTAEYLYKQYDVAGTEAYKDRLLNDIFKLSNVPNLDDEKFGTSSGIAIQYKLVGLRQVQSIKENYYVKALRNRYQLIENIHNELHDIEIKADALTFTFHPNLPQDIWEEVEKFVQAGGDLSQETLTELASFTDVKTEADRLKKERKKRNEERPAPRIPVGEVEDDSDGETDEETS